MLIYLMNIYLKDLNKYKPESSIVYQHIPYIMINGDYLRNGKMFKYESIYKVIHNINRLKWKKKGTIQ